MLTLFTSSRARCDTAPAAPVLLVMAFGLGLIPACEQNDPPGGRSSGLAREQKLPAAPSAQGNDAVRKKQPDEYAAERQEMVDRQIEARGIDDPRVLAAMRTVPRHWFVPDDWQRLAYADRPLPIGEGQTISQPYIVALMTEALHVTPDSKVLEIGTGSGYQAAVLSEITPHVFTIEIVEPLARRALATFERHGYEGIRVRIGDGYAGWPEHAPFDAIIVTCAPDRIPPKLIEQLKPGGRMCIPVGGAHAVQRLIVVTKDDMGTPHREELIPVRFVPMTGAAQDRSSDD